MIFQKLISIGSMEEWKSGRMEKWKNGKIGKLEECIFAVL
jgi:hypothetical protein